MGSFTSNLKLYKPDATEFVDAKTQLNNNLDIADSAVRRLLEYEYSSLAAPDVSNALSRSRFYKPYSNSAIAWISGTGFYQDPRVSVSPWKTVDPDGLNVQLYLTEGFMQHPDLPLAYRIIKKTGGTTTEIEWTGAIQTVTQGPMDVNLTDLVMSGIHAEATPTVSHYFLMNGGNTSANYSIGRVFVSSGGTIEFYRYGDNPSGGASSENRIELTGLRYCLEVTGT